MYPKLPELIRYLKKLEYNKITYAKKCISLCGLVKFAKYQTSKEDFGKIMELALKMI